MQGTAFLWHCMATQYLPRIHHRYKCYMKSSFNKISNMASLPPTEAAAHQHSLRVYHQIQHWLGNKKRPEDWGWKRTISGLKHVKILKPPAPDSILQEEVHGKLQP
ncbi:hypothetical protein AVEN_187191-1 [Araneus ventricosus]|uniref:Uncharacterized protein n=1 Tax=Araneus ventricosus TaxID=182803 RepID=A0A4Y2MIB2_ARAVE|nr:hypothetical protein AVEN_187191-1 [Araneus ventricosus]